MTLCCLLFRHPYSPKHHPALLEPPLSRVNIGNDGTQRRSQGPGNGRRPRHIPRVPHARQPCLGSIIERTRALDPIVEDIRRAAIPAPITSITPQVRRDQPAACRQRLLVQPTLPHPVYCVQQLCQPAAALQRPPIPSTVADTLGCLPLRRDTGCKPASHRRRRNIGRPGWILRNRPVVHPRLKSAANRHPDSVVSSLSLLRRRSVVLPRLCAIRPPVVSFKQPVPVHGPVPELLGCPSAVLSEGRLPAEATPVSPRDGPSPTCRSLSDCKRGWRADLGTLQSPDSFSRHRGPRLPHL